MFFFFFKLFFFQTFIRNGPLQFMIGLSSYSQRRLGLLLQVSQVHDVYVYFSIWIIIPTSWFLNELLNSSS